MSASPVSAPRTSGTANGASLCPGAMPLAAVCLVLALFVNGGGCAEILGDLQTLTSSFPGVRFAGVAIKGNRDALRQLVRSRRLSFPVGIDSDGALAGLYKVASCPQVSFALPGGVVQSAALLRRPALALLRARVSELAAAARAHGWRGAGA